tara:strand:- start:2 stop:193 length:192 start_codon:yes stop_codon:yes gene_type:complete
MQCGAPYNEVPFLLERKSMNNSRIKSDTSIKDIPYGVWKEFIKGQEIKDSSKCFAEDALRSKS